MLRSIPKTALDLHNEQVQLDRAICLLHELKQAPDGRPGVDRLHDLATLAASRIGGTTIMFGGCSNAALFALNTLNGYHAWINGYDRYVLIDRVDLNRELLLCYDTSPATGATVEDLASIPLHRVKTVSL